MSDTTASITRLRQPAKDRVPLTEARIREVRPHAKRYWISDATTPGLALRVSPSGERAYYVRGRIGGGRSARQIDYRLDDPARLPLAQARKQALLILAQMKHGNDPRLLKPSDRRLSGLLDDYETHLRGRQVVKAKDIMSCLRRCLHRYRHLEVSSLTRAICVAEIDAVEAGGKPGAAQDFRKHIAVFLNWCVNQGHLSASPLAGYRRPRQTRAQRLAQVRPTYTGLESLRRLWAALEAAQAPGFASLLKLGLLTGLRRGELAALTWAHVDLGESNPRIALPAVITKTGEARALPLGPMSLAILREQPRMAGTDLVFPGRRQRPISGWSQRLAPVKRALNAPDFGLHALRRSYRSGLSDTGVTQDIAEVMVGHRRPGLVGTYDRSDVWLARVNAQARWESLISRL